jgi:type III secretion protein N (ATPase)
VIARRIGAREAERAVLGYGLLGRAVDANGAAIDGGAAPSGRQGSLAIAAPSPLDRAPVCTPFHTGIRSVDGLLTFGRGARIGIFGPAGTGKSTLLEAIAGGAQADAVVIALCGERGREASAWIGRLHPRTTIVCATGDRPASERTRAARLAFAHASVLRRHGLCVLLILDSLARYAYALRDLRLARGEFPGRAGYPPGVFADLARLLECAGAGPCGSITLVATVLSDPDDDDPLSEAARSMLDGHVVLSTSRAAAGAFPAVDVLASVSRTMGSVVTGGHARAAAAVRSALARLSETKDARELGFAANGDPAVVRALRAEPAIEAFLRQKPGSSFEATVAELYALERWLEA